MDKHPFEIFTDYPWVWGPLYGICLLIGIVMLVMGQTTGALLFIGGVAGSILVISFWAVLFWALRK
jgi:hypothetical protein